MNDGQGAMMKPRHWLAFILLGVIWSSSFLWIKIGLQELGPGMLVSFRMLFGALTAVAIAAQRRTTWPRDGRTWRVFAVLGSTSLVIPIFLISWGERSIDSAVASVLNATVPLFTLVIAHLALRDDRMTVRKTMGLLTGFAGVAILVSEGLMGASRSSLLGQSAVIAAAVFYAASAVYARKAAAHVDGWLLGAGPLVMAALTAWLLVTWLEPPRGVPARLSTWIAILWLGVMGSGLALALFYYLLHEIGPTRSSMVTYLFPLGGVVLGVVFLGEHLSWQLAAGTILIVSGIVVVNRRPKASIQAGDRQPPAPGLLPAPCQECERCG